MNMYRTKRTRNPMSIIGKMGALAFGVLGGGSDDKEGSPDILASRLATASRTARSWFPLRNCGTRISRMILEATASGTTPSKP